ncbi:hypothetical protein [Anaerosporobacter sp.]
MSQKNRFILIVISLLSIGICVALYVRNSIYPFTYDTLKELSPTLSYHPYEDVMYSNGSFLEMSDSLDIIDKSKYIVIGKVPTEREILSGAIKTKIEIIKTLKGNLNTNEIYIYEPFDISLTNNCIFTYEGYNILQSDKEYILCLSDTIKGVFMFTTPSLAKFPLDYDSDDFLIVTQNELDEDSIYKNYENYEQLFSTEESYQSYLKTYNKLLKLIDDVH